MAANGAADEASGQRPSLAASVSTQRRRSSSPIVTAAPFDLRSTSSACTVPCSAPIEVAIDGVLRGDSGGSASPPSIAATSEPETSAATKRGTRSIQPNAFSSSKPFHMPYSASP